MVAIPDQTKTRRAITSLPVGEKARIRSIHNPDYASKLMAMGIRPGQFIRLIRKAPFGGGWYAQVGTHFFALRRNEAEAIIVDL